MSLVLPSSWNQQRAANRRDSLDDDLFDEDDGEGMVGFEVDDARRRELERRVEGDVDRPERRFSRDLEEGFRDDSDDDGSVDRRRDSTGA